MANLTFIQACARTAKLAYQAAIDKMNTALGGYVEKVDGKGLSTNDYTTTEKNKLAGIAAGANKTVVDSALSGTSTNPVQNKALYAKFAGIESANQERDTQYFNSLNGVAQNVAALMAAKDQANGYASLDASGKVPQSQLPSYVDDVIEGYLSEGKFYKESAHTTEITGESGKIYVDLTSSKTYRWSGTAYAVISETIALGETSSTAYRGDRGKTAYDHSQKTSGNPHKVTKSDVGLGSVPNVTTDNQTPSFTQAATLANITSKEKLSVMLGKIAKAIADFITHKGDKVSHITSAERTAWNAKSEFTGNYEDLNGAPAKIIIASPDYDYIMLVDSTGNVIGGPENAAKIPIVTDDHPGFMTPRELRMLSINETELDTAVTTALSEATA